MQEKNLKVVKLLNAAESTKFNYERVLQKDPGQQWLHFHSTKFWDHIDAIESNEDEDGEPIYQGCKLVNYSIEKWYLLDHGQYILKNLKDCFEQRYNNLFGKDANININFDKGDHVLFDVSCLLNWNVWQNSGEAEEESCDWQLKLFQNMILYYGGGWKS